MWLGRRSEKRKAAPENERGLGRPANQPRLTAGMMLRAGLDTGSKITVVASLEGILAFCRPGYASYPRCHSQSTANRYSAPWPRFKRSEGDQTTDDFPACPSTPPQPLNPTRNSPYAATMICAMLWAAFDSGV